MACSVIPIPRRPRFVCAPRNCFGVEPDWILCGNGSDELLTIVVRAFVPAGQSIRCLTPSYSLYLTLAQIQGARCERVRYQRDWQPPVAFMEPDPRVRLTLLANPNSPSGTMVPADEVLRMAKLLGSPLLVDEAYVDFSESHCLSLVREADNILVSRSLSKSYALAGLRFGYLVARPELIRELHKVRDSYNCDTLATAGATAAIDDQDWLAVTRARILATRARMLPMLREMGFEVTPSQANFLWCTRPERSVRPLYEQLKAQHILVRYMEYPEWGEGLRISVGTDAEIDASLSVLQSLVAKEN